MAVTTNTKPAQSIFLNLSLQLPVTGFSGSKKYMHTKQTLAMIGGIQKIHLQASPPLRNISAAIKGPVHEPNPIAVLKSP